MPRGEVPQPNQLVVATGRILHEHGRQFLGRGNAQLFVDIFAPKHHLDGRHRHAKQRRQKPHHVVRRLARLGRGRHADLELRALGLANGVLAGAGLAQNVDDEHLALPRKKGLARGVANRVVAHGVWDG